MPSEDLEIEERNGKKMVKFADGVDPRMKQIVEKITSITKYYSSIENYLNSEKTSITLIAFSESISDFRKEFVDQICSIESQSRKEHWTLQQIVCELQRQLSILFSIETVIEKIKDEKLPSEILRNLMQQKASLGSERKCYEMIQKIIIKTFKPMFDFICKWMNEGELLYDEFFIKFIDNEYVLVKEEVPLQLQKLAETIFTAGKYVKTIKEYRKLHENEMFRKLLIRNNESLSRQQTGNLQAMIEETPEIHEPTEILLDNDEIEVLPTITIGSEYLFDQLHLPKKINEHSVIINNYLLNVMKNSGMDKVFSNIHRLYLFSDPIVYVNFFEIASTYLSEVYNEDKESSITFRLFDNLYFELKDKVASDDLQLSFTDLLLNVFDKNDEREYVYEKFMIKYRIPYPLNLIIDEKATQQYQYVYQFIFQLHYYNYLFGRMVSRINDKSRELYKNKDYYKLSMHLTHLINSCCCCLDNLIVFCRNDVIENSWKKYKENKMQNVNELYKSHKEMLNDIIKNIGLNDSSIVQIYHKLLEHFKEVLMTLYSIDKQSDLKEKTDDDDLKEIDRLTRETHVLLTDISSLLPNSAISKRNSCYDNLGNKTKKTMEEEPLENLLNTH